MTTRRSFPKSMGAALAALALGCGPILPQATAASPGASPPDAAAAAAPAAPIVRVGVFSDGLAAWREVSLKQELRRNQFRLRDWDGTMAVEVRSEAAMSLLARPIDVDLGATPILCWRWRIERRLERADLTRRAGDDYAARLYVSLRLPPFELTLADRATLALGRAIWGPDLPDAAINYVWDNRHPVGTSRRNAYSDRATMQVMRGGDAPTGRWVAERRDVAADVARLVSPRAAAVQLAITADTDDTGEHAHSGFADIHFVARDRPCAVAMPPR